MAEPQAAIDARLPRRLASMLYEALLVAGLVLLLALVFPGAATGRLSGLARHALLLYLTVAVVVYFGWFWTRGQTLAMKAWRLHLVDAAGRRIDPPRALVRIAAAGVPVALALGAVVWLAQQRDSMIAWLALAPLALDLAWTFIDAQRRALHDVIAGTRLIVALRPTS